MSGIEHHQLNNPAWLEREQEWVGKIRTLVNSFLTVEGWIHPDPSGFLGREQLECALLCNDQFEFSDECVVQVICDPEHPRADIRFKIDDPEIRPCPTCHGMILQKTCPTCYGSGESGPFEFIIETKVSLRRESPSGSILNEEFDFS